MLYATFPQFRYHFALRGEMTGSPTFTFTAPHTITRSAGTWAGDGVLDGHDIDLFNCGSQSGRKTGVTITAPTVITVNETLGAGVALTPSFVSAFHDVDGLETWPVAIVRSGGFSGGITGTPTPYALTQFELTCNAGAADAVPWTDEYDWYFSQRTDDPAKQLLVATRKPFSGGDTYSGTIQVVHTALALTELGFTGVSDFTPQLVVHLFKNVHAYVRRKSDGAIQWLDVLRAMTAGA